MRNILFLILIWGLMTSCARNEKQIPKKSLSISLVKTDSIHLDFLLNPFRWAIDQGVLYAYDPNQKPSLVLYDLIDSHRLFAYNIIGDGPQEFNLPGMCKLNNKRELALYEERRNKFVVYSTADSLLKELYSYKFPESDFKMLYSRLFHVDGSQYIGVSFTPKLIICHLLDLKSEKILDELILNDKTKNNASLYYSVFDYNNDKLIVGYELFNSIQIYSVENNRFRMDIGIGDQIKDDMQFVDEKNRRIYYTDVLSADKYYLALIQDCLEDDLYSGNSKLEMFDKNGHLIKLIDLQRPISKILWDPQTEEIIAYNPIMEKSCIYKYKID